jgi:long-chain acyl-CoA synthetase
MSSSPASATGSASADRPWFAQYAPGVPREIEVPSEAIGAVLTDTAARYPGTIALDFFGATTTYAQLLAQVERAAQVLHELGVRAGDRVAVLLPNCPQHVVAFYAILRIGAVVAEHNPLASPEEIRVQLARHGAKVVVAWEKSLPLVAAEPGRTVLAVDLTASLPWTKRALLRLPISKARAQRAVMRGPVPEGVRSWDRTVRRGARYPASRPYPNTGDLAVLLHTGGTTGVPKAVALTHRNLQANCTQGQMWVQGLREGAETIYAVLPFFHAFGLTLCLTFTVRMAATSVLMPRFEAPAVLAAMKRRPATFFPGVPPMFDRVAAEAERDGVDLTSIRFSIAGAMPLAQSVAERWERQTGGLVVEGYGMTECSPVAVGNPLGPARRPGTLGVPFPSTDVRVVDPAASSCCTARRSSAATTRIPKRRPSCCYPAGGCARATS